MNEELMNSEGPGDRRGPLRTVVRSLGWILTGVLLTVFLIADPLDIHPVDKWMQEMLSIGGNGDAQAAPGEREVLFYRSPMDPTVTSAVPATDDMGMDYIPVYADEAEGSPGSEREILFYRNPMNPTITSPVPAKDSMGMDYVPVYAVEAGAPSAGGPVVMIDPATVQNMNIQVEAAVRRDVTHHIRTVGYLEYDQERMVSITTKFSGWIEKVHVNYVGERVEQGQPLFEIYSPELVQTEQELLSALEYARRIENAPEDVRRRAEDLVVAARERLGYWDISAEQVETLERDRKVVRTLTVTAPSSGVVMMRMAGLEGMSVRPGMELFHIADLSSLWLKVDVFEGQLNFVDVGSRADVTLSYFPGETFRGVVRFVEPEVSAKTRSVALLLEVRNPRGKLKTGMFATVVFEPVISRDAVTIPRLAIIRTGERDIVIVQSEPGRFAPRPVRLGHEGLVATEVLEGIEEGDLIVTSAQFLIDSESSLQAAIQKMMAAREEEAAATDEADASSHEGSDHAQ